MFLSKLFLGKTIRKIKSDFTLKIGKHQGTYAGITTTTFGFQTNNIGSISPNSFLGKTISDFAGQSIEVSGVQSHCVFVRLSSQSTGDFKGSKLKIQRTDTGDSCNAVYNESSFGDIDEWSGNLEYRFFSDSDVGKVIPILIEYTPPHRRLRLLIQAIQNRLQSFHEFCAGFCVLGIQEVVC